MLHLVRALLHVRSGTPEAFVITNSNKVTNGGERQHRPSRLRLWIPVALALAALAFAGTSAHFLRPRASLLSGARAPRRPRLPYFSSRI